MIDVLVWLRSQERAYLACGSAKTSARFACAADEIERLWGSLPKTVDGVTIVPTMRVWRLEHPTTLGEEVCHVDQTRAHLSAMDRMYRDSELASTFEAAEAARGKECLKRTQ